MKSFTIDPRLHDGVIFDLDNPNTLTSKLQAASVAMAAYSPGQPDPAGFLAVAAQLGVAPERAVVVSGGAAGVRAARAAGFAVVIAVSPQGHSDDLQRSGADVVVPDLGAVEVRTGDERMSALPNALDSSSELLGIVGGRQPLICLDYDGTLSEIVPDPDAAALVDGAAEVLGRLAAQCPVAILSGRGLADIRERVAVPGIWYAGSHGFEMIGPDGSRDQYEAASAAVEVLADAAAELCEELDEVAGVRVEHKRFAVAAHYRNVAAERAAEVIAAAHRQGLRRGLRVTGGRKVVELRPDVDWDKGTALARIRDRINQTEPMLPIYIGDDLTDEDAFDAVRRNGIGGIGIVVRHDEDGDRPTAAGFTLRSPTEVCELLRRVSHWLAHERETRETKA